MKEKLLRSLPKVSELMEKFKGEGEEVYVKQAIRQVLAEVRQEIILGKRDKLDDLENLIKQRIKELSSTKLKRVVNATGVIINTNLGRSVLPQVVADFIEQIATHYSNLEYNLQEGRRGSRQSIVEEYLKELTGCEDAMVVNNNASAVFLVLNSLAKDKEVIVPRGELVEIGGSFRIPDIMRMSGAKLVEVGTTNKTKLRDYQSAISENTALIMKVHRSNFYMEGFTEEVSLKDLLSLGHPVYYDAGSGAMLDLKSLGINVEEPSFVETISLGVHIVSGSGDKLLGGPQAGIILGKKEFVERIKSNPLSRIVRIDKLTLAGLEATLRLYIEGRYSEIPTIRMLTLSESELKRRAFRLIKRLKGIKSLDIRVIKDVSQCGGGTLPNLYMPTYCVAIKHKHLSTNKLQEKLRKAEIPIVCRVKDDNILVDTRTLLPDDYAYIEKTFKSLLEQEEE